jgi:hypothetical protein
MSTDEAKDNPGNEPITTTPAASTSSSVTIEDAPDDDADSTVSSSASAPSDPPAAAAAAAADADADADAVPAPDPFIDFLSVSSFPTPSELQSFSLSCSLCSRTSGIQHCKYCGATQFCKECETNKSSAITAHRTTCRPYLTVPFDSYRPLSTLASVQSSTDPVMPVQQRGSGLKATEKLPCGSLILIEKPLILLPASPEWSYYSEKLCREIEKQVSQLESAAIRELFYSMHNSYGNSVDRAYGIVQTNLFPLFELNEMEGGSGGGGQPGSNPAGNPHRMTGLFPLAQRFRHSCVPNANAVWYPDKKELRVYLMESVEAGDEITLKWLVGVGMGNNKEKEMKKDTEKKESNNSANESNEYPVVKGRFPRVFDGRERRRLLREEYQLDCKCRLCAVERASESINHRMAVKRKELAQSKRWKTVEIVDFNGGWPHWGPQKYIEHLCALGETMNELSFYCLHGLKALIGEEDDEFKKEGLILLDRAFKSSILSRGAQHPLTQQIGKKRREFIKKRNEEIEKMKKEKEEQEMKNKEKEELIKEEKKTE